MLVALELKFSEADFRDPFVILIDAAKCAADLGRLKLNVGRCVDSQVFGKLQALSREGLNGSSAM